MNITILHDRRRTVPAVLTALVIAVGSLLIIVLSPTEVTSGNAQDPAAGVVRDTIKSFKYGPKTLTVRAGQKVAWTNQDDAPHSATVAGQFDTGLFGKGQTRTITLAKAGTYHYICTIHPFMHGTVVVR
ncbi:plastocyanin/azurin family copper-binding protein [Baekduia sp. Peel2402]|uniref:plastocyanin/azurin family copper-binding protein n=1 Tax=Baekduia sp. Peel2402 TaxID=3458296 RepID=UPI00403E3A51